jgi:hypothetical protein
MSNEYKNNHYVPVWYQKKFILDSQDVKDFFYLDLNPEKYIDSRGNKHEGKALKKLGPKKCFCADDLYLTEFDGVKSKDIEKAFFGEIDTNGQNAVSYYENFSYPWDGGDHFKEMMLYMSTQKLRTIKGLEQIKKIISSENKNETLGTMVKYGQLYCAIWTECVWQIADASNPETKFIISDHPVTVYNRVCGPSWLNRNGEPDIRQNATHTIFPLSLNKVLILTNLSWVRNPYQKELSYRPNPNFFRSAIFKITDIQTLRRLEEDEVREINYIIKSNAKRYIAAAKKEWLYPEKYISKSDWSGYGSGYLLMPDPRSVTYGGQLIIGHQNGTSTAFDEYGRRPWEKGFKGFNEKVPDNDWDTFQRFNGEFARLYGPYRRGRSFNVVHLDNEMDDEEFHKSHLRLEDKYKKIIRKKRNGC